MDNVERLKRMRTSVMTCEISTHWTRRGKIASIEYFSTFTYLLFVKRNIHSKICPNIGKSMCALSHVALNVSIANMYETFATYFVTTFCHCTYCNGQSNRISMEI